MTVAVTGDTIGVKYRIERELGTGHLGTVFEVSHGITGQRYALKLLKAEAAKAEGAVQRFLREAQVAARVQHPNIVQVYDVGQDHDSFFIVMELLDGESLAKRLSRRQRLRASVVGELLVPCMEGVAAAHAAGVIHRDLKPANIFLARSHERGPEVPKVLDFGIAKLFDRDGNSFETMTTPGAILGTPQYMSPEQLRGEPIDFRTDVYAFGVILYELLAGVRPFAASSLSTLLLRVLHEDPVPLDAHVNDLPEGLSSVVAQAMARDRAERFESVEALMRALQRCLNRTRVRQRQDVLQFQSFRPGVEPALVQPPRLSAESLRAVVTPARAPRRTPNWQMIVMVGSAIAAAIAVAVLTKPRSDVEAVSPVPPLPAATARSVEQTPPAMQGPSEASTAASPADAGTQDADVKPPARNP